MAINYTPMAQRQRSASLAEMLMRQGMGSSPRTAAEGLGSAAKSIAGALMRRGEMQKATDQQQALADALRVSLVQPEVGTVGPPVLNDQNQLLAQMLSNPATQETGIGIGLQRAFATPDSEKITPYTDFAKAKRDFDAGLITKQQYDSLTAPAPPGQELPFAGKAWNAQMGNELVNFYVSQGLSPTEAKRMAIDKINQNTVSYQKDPYTQQLVPMRGQPIFGAGTPQSGQQPSGQPSATPQQPSPPKPQPEPVPEGQFGTVWEAVEKGTGAVSGAAALWANTGGALGLPVNEEMLAARQTLQAAKGDLLRSMSQNPKFPVGEMERLEKEVGSALEPSVWTDPAVMRVRLKSLSESMKRRLRRAEEDAANTNLPMEERKSQGSVASGIKRFLDELGIPKEQPASQPSFDRNAIIEELKRRGAM